MATIKNARVVLVTICSELIQVALFANTLGYLSQNFG